MLIEYELVQLDPNSSFRLLHHNVAPSSYVWQYHYHPEIELACIVNGSGLRHVGSHMSRYEDGDLILIGGDLPHSGFGLNASIPHEEIVIQIPKPLMDKSIENFIELQDCTRLLKRARYGISFYGDTYKEVCARMIELLALPKEQRLFSVFRIFQILAQSSEYHLLNDNIIASKRLMYDKTRLQTIFSYIEENYSENLDIKEIAQIVGLTIPSFSSYFKRTTSLTFTAFVNTYRVQKACYLLKEGKSISESCHLCGYNSLSYFNRMFKRYMSMSPKQYLKSIS